MPPFIRDEDVLTIAPLKDRTACVGDVIAFVQPESGRLAIHRVIARRGQDWLIRGDNSPAPDGVVPRKNLLGIVTRVERQGRDIRLGLGAERLLIALLQRANALRRMVCIVLRIRRIPMSIRIALARRLILIGRLVQSLAQMAMRPKDLVEFSWGVKENFSRKAEWVRRAFALITVGNRAYEPGDMLWQNIEFMHGFQSEEELRSEFAKGGFQLIYLHFGDRMPRGEAALLKYEGGGIK